MSKNLLVAVQEGDLHHVKKIISSDVELLSCVDDHNKQNLLHIASFEGHKEIINFLLAAIEKALTTEKSLSDSNPLRKLINSRDNAGWTPLHCACSQNHLEIALRLLDRGADPTISNNSQSLALHYLAKQDLYPHGEAQIDLSKVEGYNSNINSNSSNNSNNSTPKIKLKILKTLPKQVMESSVKVLTAKLKNMSEEGGLPGIILDIMLNKRCNINAVNSGGETPLLLACLHSYKENVVLLLSRGAYAFTVNKLGESCYDYARRRENMEICELLNAFGDLFSTNVPDEILEEIFKHLKAKDLCNISLVCRRFLRISNSNSLWKHIYYSNVISTRNDPGVINDYKSHYKKLCTVGRHSLGKLPPNWKELWDNPIGSDTEHHIVNSEYDYLFKILTIGDTGVGKSSLLLREKDNTFTDSYISTIRADFKIKRVGLYNKTAKLQIWDKEAQERFRTVANSYYRGGHGVLVMFDLTDAVSWSNVKQWLQEIDRYACHNVNKMIVGCKADLFEERRIEYQDAKEFADSLDIPYIETSAKLSTNVSLMYAEMAYSILNRLNPEVDFQSKPVQQTNIKNQKCSIM